MFAARHNFGVIDSIKPEAMGTPGKRIFRILVDGSAAAAATLWVEKEQVYGLSVAMKRMLEGGQGGGRGEPDFPRLDPAALGGGSREALEFKVSRLGLAFGPGEEHLTLFFHDEREEPEEEGEDEDDEEDEEEPKVPPKLQVSVTRTQAEAFIRESLEITASGRGTDALSRHALVAAGKVDPNRNGYFRH